MSIETDWTREGNLVYKYPDVGPKANGAKLIIFFCLCGCQSMTLCQRQRKVCRLRQYQVVNLSFRSQLLFVVDKKPPSLCCL
jgi:hypothetical protein